MKLQDLVFAMLGFGEVVELLQMGSEWQLKDLRDRSRIP